MDKQQTLARLRDLYIVAVLRGPSPELTIQMVEALVAGGVRAIEITYTTPNAEEVLRRLDETFGDEILLGMGTLTKAEQAASAKAAGAKFLVSPMYEAELVEGMVASGLPIMVGALTPAEVFQAYRAGSDVIKIFPGSLVGPSYLKALHGPFPDIPMMPTGGVSIENVAAWLQAGAVAVGAGSELCSAKLAQAGEFVKISANARRFNEAVAAAKTAV
jgi:2-dehydro-3-deoxyphosphogluconate aldolase/(4S)-4-hydroxy-2-oxoglutarate aldolase